MEVEVGKPNENWLEELLPQLGWRILARNIRIREMSLTESENEEEREGEDYEWETETEGDYEEEEETCGVTRIHGIRRYEGVLQIHVEWETESPEGIRLS
jgi:hypothetical protein